MIPEPVKKPMSEWYAYVGQELRRERLINHLKTEPFAELLGTSIRSLLRYEKGECAIPIPIFYRWCKHLDIDIDQLVLDANAEPAGFVSSATKPGPEASESKVRCSHCTVYAAIIIDELPLCTWHARTQGEDEDT